MPASGCTWRLVTPPPTGSAAIAAISLHGDVEAGLAAMSIQPVGVGAVALRRLAGIDTGIAARFSRELCFLMPHAGPMVVRGLIDALRGSGH